MTDGPTTEPAPECVRHAGAPAVARCQRCGAPCCADCIVVLGGSLLCPTCTHAASVAPAPAAPARGRPPRAPVTIALVAVNAAVFVAAQVVPDGVEAGAASRAAVLGGAWWQLLTSMFIHLGLLHLGTNMVSLWFLGRALEPVLHSGWFLGLYLVSGLVGGAAWVLLGPPNGFAVGASGAIAGLFGALFVLVLRRRHDPASRSLLSQLLVLLVLNIGISAMPGIAWQAHLGGVLAGFALGAAFDTTEDARARAGVLGVGLVAVAACLLVAN